MEPAPQTHRLPLVPLIAGAAFLVLLAFVAVEVASTPGVTAPTSDPAEADVTPRLPTPPFAQNGSARKDAESGAFEAVAGPDPTLTKQQSHRKMVERLRQLADVAAEVDPYSGTQIIDELKRDLKLEERRGDPRRIFSIQMRLGDELLRVGETQQAIALYEQGLNLLEELGAQVVPSQLLARGHRTLGIAFLRLTENENCVMCRGGEGCILPFRGTGVHSVREPTEKAAFHLQKAAQLDPTDHASAWLLNIAHLALDEGDRVPENFRLPDDTFESPKESIPEFPNVADELNVSVIDLAGGAIADDFDGDSDVDILTSTTDPRGPMHLFLNDGAGQFKDVTAQAGLDGINGGLNMVQADYDGDGDVDVLVLRGGWREEHGRLPNSLLENDGSGRFVDVSYRVGLAGVDWPTQTAAWQDYDHDGDLDLYVGNENAPSQLFQQQEDGTFIDAAAEAGVTNDRFAKAVVWGDYNSDDFADLFVSNFNGLNRLYRNRGDGTFVDVAADLGVSTPRKSFPSWFWDFDNDGSLDLFVSSYEYHVEYLARQYLEGEVAGEVDSLYVFDGETAKDLSADLGLARVTQPMGANFGDLDNDGYLDFYLGTGYPQYEALMPNVMYRNERGSGFRDVTYAGRFGHLQKGHGVAFADFDGDGDQDIYHQLGGIYPGDGFGNAYFRNPGNDNHWIKIQLHGKRSDRFGLGARIKLTFDDGGEVRSVYRWVNSGGSFGGNPMRQEIGLGDAETIESIEVHWPTTGRTQRLENVAADQAIEIIEEG